MFEPSHQSPVTAFAAQVAEVEVDPETGQVHGKAIGEIPNVPTAAAIANAIADATGVRLFELPLTAEKIHRALKETT